MNNNEAIVCKLGNIKPIEGADKIVCADVILNNISLTQIVVGIETKEDTPIVYFDSNLALDQNVIEAIDKLDVHYNEEGFRGVGGYLAKGNRIRCIKLKNTSSNGLAINVEKFYQFFKSEEIAKKVLVEGFSFTKLGEVDICAKYILPVKNVSTRTNKTKNKKERDKTQVIIGHFPEHTDTEQLIRNIHKINPNDCIQISSKWHGTSSRCGNVLTTKKLSIFEKILKFVGISVVDKEYHYVYGSRRVTKKIDEIENKTEKKHFYSFDLWTDAGEKYFKGKLAKGEIVFFEIVGELPDGKAIQKIGKNIYNYGVPHKEYGIYVYRITLTNEDGYTIEYDCQTVKERCKELGVKHVDEFYYGLAKDKYPSIVVDENWHSNFLNALKKEYLEQIRSDCFSPKTYDEGVVIRREIGLGIDAFKLKSESFLTAESKALDEETVEDLEA